MNPSGSSYVGRIRVNLHPGCIVACNESDYATGLVVAVDCDGPRGCQLRLRVIRLCMRRIELWWGDVDDYVIVLRPSARPT